jgi:hypothetical protein
MVKKLGLILGLALVCAHAQVLPSKDYAKPHLQHLPPVGPPFTFTCDSGYSLYVIADCQMPAETHPWIPVSSGTFTSKDIAQHSGPRHICYLTSKGAPPPLVCK